MEITVTPFRKTAQSTISKFSLPGFSCYVLEDVDRGLKQTDPLEDIKAKKIHGLTAIPEGRYEVVINFSNRFQKYLPQILNVPGFEGIRIHPGNKPEDTEGCLLPGLAAGQNTVIQSIAAFNCIMTILRPAEEKEKIFITITR